MSSPLPGPASGPLPNRPAPGPSPVPVPDRPVVPPIAPRRPGGGPPARPQPLGWGRALLVMVGIAGLLWVVQVANAADSYDFDRFGLKPRSAAGLWGIVTMPFLHGGYRHLLSNTLPLVLIGWVLLLSGLRAWAVVTGIVVVGGGVLTWLVGPGGSVIVGASAMIFGWMGYLLARAYLTRKLKWILAAVVVLVFFGTLLFGLLPNVSAGVSWQAHVCGFVAGVGSGVLLHPRKRERRPARRPVVS